MTRSSSSLLPAEANEFISEAPLDLISLLRDAHHPAAGAVVLFSGEVRDHNKGREVAYLEYEAYYPMADKMIRRILSDAVEKWGLKVAVAQHRVGKLHIGEA